MKEPEPDEPNAENIITLSREKVHIFPDFPDLDGINMDTAIIKINIFNPTDHDVQVSPNLVCENNVAIDFETNPQKISANSTSSFLAKFKIRNIHQTTKMNCKITADIAEKTYQKDLIIYPMHIG